MSRTMVIAGHPGGVLLISPRGWKGWRFSYNADDGEVRVRPPKGTRIDATTWRRMPIGQIMATARHAARGDIDLSPIRDLAVRPDGVDGSPNDDGLTRTRDGDAHYKAVAAVYQRALEYGVRPVAAVAEVWNREMPTAQRWVAKAREMVLLGSYADEKEEAERRATRHAETNA